MKKLLTIIAVLMVTLTVACQDKDFYKRTNHYKGLYTTFVVFPDSTKLTTANLGSADWSTITGKPNIFPTSWEIVLNKPDFNALYKSITWFPTWNEVTGKPSTFPSTWATVSGKPTFSTVATTGSYTDLLNIPTTFTPAAHNHNDLYKPIGYVPTWNEITGKPTTFTPATHNHNDLYKPIGYVPTWNEITSKPATFPSTWSTVSGKPTFSTVATTGSYTDLLNIPTTFVPAAHTHDYQTDIINKPAEQELLQAIAGLDYLPIPRKTTAQINAMTMPANTCGLVNDITLNVLKMWDGTKWNILITSY